MTNRVTNIIHKDRQCTLHETSTFAPETLGLVQMSFLFWGFGLFSGAFAVSFRVDSGWNFVDRCSMPGWGCGTSLKPQLFKPTFLSDLFTDETVFQGSFGSC